MADHRTVLLDTSVAITPPTDLADIAERVAVSAISVAELASGLTSAADPVESARRHERFARLLATCQIVPYTASAARLYGALCESVRLSGRNPLARRFDLLIASVAGDLGIPVLTRNGDDFRDIHPVVEVVELS